MFFVCFVFVPPIHVGIVECVNLTERAKILRLQKRERESARKLRVRVFVRRREREKEIIV